ncbi:hypothetical protein KM043_018836 [Ampulex compressa]|nr:hypothetical protein KM043_018836 [Ampulex compressa]
MKFFAHLLVFVLLYASQASGSRKKRDITQILMKAGGDILQKTLKNAAFLIASEAASSFLKREEVELLRRLMRKLEIEKLESIAKERMLKSALMLNITTSIYNHSYECKVGHDYIDLTFRFGAPNVVLPDKWVLKFFN